MTTPTVQAWLSSDGKPHLSAEAARDRNFEIAFDEWLVVVRTRFADPQQETIGQIRAVILEDARRLLPVFKLLEGGPINGTTTAPARPEPIAEPPVNPEDKTNIVNIGDQK